MSLSSILVMAQTKMFVNLKDGAKVDFMITNVDSISFGDDESSSEIQYVDLGLSVNWAKYNIGSKKLDDFGDYFAWAETKSKRSYTDESYRYIVDLEDSLTKYNNGNSKGFIDSLTTLLSEDDAATENLGKEWRTPTKNEILELIEECQWSWSYINGIGGYNVIAKNGNSIFLPAVGNCSGSSAGSGHYGCYWSSSLYSIDPNSAYNLYFQYENKTSCSYDRRSLGFAVRPVYSKINYETPSYFSVSFYTDDKRLLQTQNIKKGKPASEVIAPTKIGCKFVGWSAPTDSVISDMSVYAVYEETKKFIVSFYSADSILIDEHKVEIGKSTIKNDAPEITGYKFIGWSAPTDSVISDMSVYAVYEEDPDAGKYVDLGLPSGTLWASYNIGATKPEEFGDYFAWGETNSKEMYDYGTYKLSVGEDLNLDHLIKYNNDSYYGKIDTLTTLLPEDDAAYVNWGKVAYANI